jgi:hypothetical protein
MFIHARDTTINKGLKETSIIDTLKEHLVRNYKQGNSQFIDMQTDVIDSFKVLGLADGTTITPRPFVQPILLEHDGVEYLIADVRSCTRYNKQDGRAVITNPTLFKREIIRTILESVWITGGATDILNLGNIQVQIFSSWISELFTRRFGLDATQQIQISVIGAFYYLCLFSEADKIDQRRLIPIIVRATRTGAPFVLETLRDIDYIANIDELLDVIPRLVSTTRLDGVTPDVFITMLGGSWFGPNNAILAGTAVEYPPVWNALVYLALTENANRATGIGKIALRKERDPLTREYLAALNLLLKNHTTIDPTTYRG